MNVVQVYLPPEVLLGIPAKGDAAAAAQVRWQMNRVVGQLPGAQPMVLPTALVTFRAEWVLTLLPPSTHDDAVHVTVLAHSNVSCP